MKIKFHGAIGTVTGSCYELYDPAADARFLVDCGMQQGESNAAEWNRREFDFDATALDFVVLTHGHLDHCGLIPLLYKRGYRGEVYCTKETADLAKIVLEDAVKHSDLYAAQDVEQIRWREHQQGPILDKWLQTKGDICFRYIRSAHILGATSVEFWWGEPKQNNKILFSGDIGNNREGEEFQPLMRHGMCPGHSPSKNRYVVMESTYGGRDMRRADRSFEKRQQRLFEHIETTVRHKRGTLVIPCFAVNRTQDVLFDLHYLFAKNAELADIPVFFDAKMARRVNLAYASGLAREEVSTACGEVGQTPKKELMWLNDRLFEWMGLDRERRADRDLLIYLLQEMLVEEASYPGSLDDHPSEIARRWRRIWQPGTAHFDMADEVGGPCIVVTGGGMCDGGPVASYLQELARDRRHTILLTGYCAPSTNGGKLNILAGKTREERQEFGDSLRWDRGKALPLAEVRADIEMIGGYSGHADRKRLIDWLFPESQGFAEPLGATVFLTHGTDEARQALREKVLGFSRRKKREGADIPANFSVKLPTRDDGWFDLDAGQWSSRSMGASEQSGVAVLAERSVLT